MISDIIEVSKGFQSSVNIEYDLNDSSKISGFIPTTSGLAVINDIITNTETDSTGRAKILTGAYGRGKSHIVLVALSVLYNKDSKLFEKLIKNIQKIDKDIAQNIQNYIISKKRLLPVIINGNSGNLSNSFLSALQHALSVYGLDDIMPDTYFDAAIECINKWESDYPDTLKRFEKQIGCKAKKFVDEMQHSNEEIYGKFIEIYPELTSGAVFNPFVDANVVNTYDGVNKELKSKGYTGMYVVYDEFGKYLETNISRSSESDMKLLQDMAEKCNRSSEQQMHLMLICHKDISNYIDDGLPQDKVDGWRGISGRFEHIALSNNFHQMYEIISSAIVKNKSEWKRYKKQNESVFEELYDSAVQKNYLSGKEELVVNECYPLHPVTTFLLPRLSERIAQNERTLFTFLTADQRNTLRDFVNTSEDKFPILTPDRLFDYFEQELKRELRASDIHKIYHLAVTLLNKPDIDDLQVKIIKSIAVIYCVEQFERVSPTFETITDIYSTIYDRKYISEAINDLIEHKYVVYRKNNNILCLKESSGVDINAELTNEETRVKNELDTVTALNIISQNNYVYPVRHNEEKCLTRYFCFKFLNCLDIIEGHIPEMVKGASGCVYGVVFSTEQEYKKFSSKVKKSDAIHDEVLVIPEEYKDIDSLIYRYLAASRLRDLCASEDEVLRSEYQMIVDDLETVVYGFISLYTSPEKGMSSYYYKGKKQKVTRRSELTELLSNICDEIYPHTPIVNNESINKDKLPGVAITSRSKLISAILSAEDENIEVDLGLTGTGQDVSFMRSTLVRTGILYKDSDRYILTEDCSDESIKYVLSVIHNFFTSTATDGEKSLGELYTILTDNKSGIGMKTGPIPVYIAVALRAIKNDLIFKSNENEIRINADLLNSINERPDIYTVQMENWSDDKKEYLISLESCFADHIIDKGRAANTITAVVNAIDRWYLSLPKCARELEKDYMTGKAIASNHKKFYKLLKIPQKNAHSFLMERIPSEMKFDAVSSTVADVVKACREELDIAKNTLIKRIICETRNIFDKKKEKSLSIIMKNWYATLSDKTHEHLFANNENMILSLIQNMTIDEESFAQRLAKVVTGLDVNDWSFSILESFITKLKDFKDTVEEYNIQSHESESQGSSYRITVTDDDGNEKVMSFDKIEYSSRAKLLYRDITGAISDMGQSITEQEKRQVLLEILESLC